MNQNEINGPAPGATYDDDTISLVDLLAVVVRYRRLIIIGTVAVAIAAVVYAYVMPRVGSHPEAEPAYKAEQKIVVAPLPEAIEEVTFFDPVTVTREILSGDSTVTETRSGNTVTFTVSRTHGDRARAEEALTEMAVAFETAFGEVVVSSFRPVVEAYDAAIGQAQGVITGIATETFAAGEQRQNYGEALAAIGVPTLVDSIITRNRLASFLQQPTNLVSVTPARIEPAPPESGTSSSMIVVIATITAFFLSVFLAFVLEYVRRVRQDPEEIGKLRAAWRREES